MDADKKFVILATKKIIDACVVHFTDMTNGRLDVNMCIDALFNTLQHISAISLLEDANKDALVKEWDNTIKDLMRNIVRDLNNPEIIRDKQRFVTMSYVEVLKDMTSEKSPPATTH